MQTFGTCIRSIVFVRYVVFDSGRITVQAYLIGCGLYRGSMSILVALCAVWMVVLIAFWSQKYQIFGQHIGQNTAERSIVQRKVGFHKMEPSKVGDKPTDDVDWYYRMFDGK